MKIEYRFKKTIWGCKRSIDIFDFEGQEKELKKILEGLKVVKR